ncbi:MAG: GWxTD domain-containing protein [Ignavibacteriaceae bacterium]
MKTKLLLTAVLFLSCTITYAQNNQFNFDFDYAQFGYDSTSNYVEFYYSFNQNSMEVKSTDSADYLDGILSFIIIDTLKNDTTVNREWRVTHQIVDSTDLESKSLVGVIGFIIPAGTYKAEIAGYDYNNNENRKTITEYLSIKPFVMDTGKVILSDVQLASRIIQDSKNQNSIFYKNGLEVFPIPTSVFGENQPVLFYYNELYNITHGSSDSNLKLNAIVYNSRKEIVFSKNKYVSRKVNSRVEVGSVPVNKYVTDTYTLVLTIIDSVDNYGISSAKRFFVYNPSVAPVEAAGSGSEMLSSQFAVMSEEELNDLFDKSRYVATSYEIDQYKKVNSVGGKREFLYQFWKVRDVSPATSKNEYYIEYMERARASNERFTSMGKPGWKTDRGRIYMTYGEPSEIERFPNQTSSKPYEIWQYNEIEGGVYFVFGDLMGFSDYTLLHSTMRGELRDDNWESRLSSF